MSNNIAVDAGALKMVINVLNRAGKKEVAAELKSACSDEIEKLQAQLDESNSELQSAMLLLSSIRYSLKASPGQISSNLASELDVFLSPQAQEEE